MKYKVFLTDEAKEDLSCLEKIEKKKVIKSINVVEQADIDAVNTRPLTRNLYEIKSDNVRSIYAYDKDQIIIIAVIFIKTTQKTPLKYIEKAEKIIKEYRL